jgi:hypothetical protein
MNCIVHGIVLIIAGRPLAAPLAGLAGVATVSCHGSILVAHTRTHRVLLVGVGKCVLFVC